jgi:hypothetical protein
MLPPRVLRSTGAERSEGPLVTGTFGDLTSAQRLPPPALLGAVGALSGVRFRGLVGAMARGLSDLGLAQRQDNAIMSIQGFREDSVSNFTGQIG